MIINPARGCGRLKRGGYYLRGLSGVGGHLSLITWVLGNGIAGNGHPHIEITARKPKEFNPPATLLFREMCTEKPLGMTPDDECEYGDLLARTRALGIADHVGSEHYTAYQFAKELREHGLSRRVHPDFAFLVNKHVRTKGCVPIFATHSQIPYFRDKVKLRGAYELACDYFPEARDREVWEHETWLKPDWGMTEKYPDKGWGHIMLPILALVDAAYSARKSSRYYDARAIVRKWAYHETFFVATWVNQVAYVLPEDRKVPPQVAMAKLAIIDLDNEESNDG